MPTRRASEVVLGPVRLPRLIAGLILLVALVSIGSALAARNGVSAPLALGLLVPAAVLEGQVWRLLTWVLYETDPISLIFAGLMLVWFGRDLLALWGERRFLLVVAGIAVGAAGLTCLVGLVWPEVAGSAYLGNWPLLSALSIAWGTAFADRRINLYGILPLSGRQLVYLTLGMTALFAAFRGVAPYVPHAAAQVGTLLWMGPLKNLRRARTGRPGKPSGKAGPGKVVRGPWSFDDWYKDQKPN